MLLRAQPYSFTAFACPPLCNIPHDVDMLASSHACPSHLDPQGSADAPGVQPRSMSPWFAGAFENAFDISMSCLVIFAGFSPIGTTCASWLVQGVHLLLVICK